MAEHGDTWLELIGDAFTDYVHWRRNYYAKDPIVVSRTRRRAHAAFLDEVTHRLDGLVKDLKADFPVHHPRYLGHMVSEQSLPAVLGYLATVLYNPNNVTEELAPVTLQLELEVGEMIAEMLGYSRDDAWAHITSGGTAANIEALWVARTIQFVPLALRELCRSVAPTFTVQLPDGTRRQLRELEHMEALHLCPDDAISMPRQLAAFIWDEGKITELVRLVESDKEAKLTDEELEERVIDELGEDVEVSGVAVAELVQGLFRGADSSGKPVARLDGELRREKGAMVIGTEGPAYQAGRLLRAAELMDEYLAKSSWNPAWAGQHAVASASDQPLRPLLFAAETAHYSVKKACDVLGYGGDALQSVPVDDGFHIRSDALEDLIEKGLNNGGYVAAVIGIVGSTEMGAVDPIHELLNIRRRFATREKTRCFWIHVDAAWGGYMASVFRGPHAIPAQELVRFEVGGQSRECTTSWGERKEINAAFSKGLAQVDSITVDPHKLGYIPYPAGAVAFGNRGVTDIVAHKANYIAEWGSGVQATSAVSRRRINELGAHILEGSKPGAAAAACWLAHRAIPLTSDGHGQIVLSTLLNAQRLACYLKRHEDLFSEFDSDLEKELREEHGGALPAWFRSPPPKPFTFVVLGDVDTNIVCYVARHMQLTGRETLTRPTPPTPLKEINELNKRIYGRLGKVSGAEYFLSRTVLDERYSTDVRERALGTIGVDTNDSDNQKELRKNGLFVLRSTVMNPHYDLARDEANKDYLLDFVRHLHRVTREPCRRGANAISEF